jgi:hypothetical protein
MEGQRPIVVPEYFSQLANGRANSLSQNLFLTVLYNFISVFSDGEISNSVGVNESKSQRESLSLGEAIQEGVIMDTCVMEEFCPSSKMLVLCIGVSGLCVCNNVGSTPSDEILIES